MALQESVIVLRTTDYRDSDKIVSFIGKDIGKLQALARGARRSKKRFSGGIDVFDFADIVLEQSKRNRDRYSIAEYRKKHTWKNLSSSVSTFTHASLCTEVIENLSHEDDPEGRQLFTLLFSSLKALDKSKSEAERSAISCFLIISSLSLSGFFSVNELPNCSEKVKAWFLAMINQKAPIIPFEENLAEKGLDKAVSHYTEVTEQKLNSWIAIRKI